MGDFDEARESEFEEELRSLVIAIAGGANCEIFLFGSRARRTAGRASDFDIGVRGLSTREFGALKSRIEEAVEESRIPHGVDVVDFDRADEVFVAIADREKVIWKSA
ncbi:MAG TPA: nucleotidyltransferase domain-containing protein [Rectinemataceae bacterium]|nr:nucleotidyltransferase domain-containing protein [Rectinemataceae bacterium]